MALALLSLGSNLGDRRGILQAALTALAGSLGVEQVTVSSWHETAPVGGPAGQGAFLNAAALVETSLPPAELLARLQRIEFHLGRTRETRWGARTLDLDLLLYDNLVLSTPFLTLPHPRMAFRRFVLEPAVEVAPDLVHPRLSWTVQRLLDHLNESPPYAAIADAARVYAPRLAQLIACRLSVRLICDPEPSSSSMVDAEAVELARLERWRRLLNAGTWQPGQPTVSDFWFDSAVAAAATRLSPPQLAGFQHAWEAARQDVVQPRLVLRLDAPGSATPAVPWLDLDPNNLEGALEEAVAAIEAMQ
jgi:2-amino-4-hydroxy-6-hydroxymethyldihydropteridine diphosphokinase